MAPARPKRRTQLLHRRSRFPALPSSQLQAAACPAPRADLQQLSTPCSLNARLHCITSGKVRHVSVGHRTMKICNILHNSRRSFTRSVRCSCRRHVLDGRRLPLRIMLCCGRHAKSNKQSCVCGFNKSASNVKPLQTHTPHTQYDCCLQMAQPPLHPPPSPPPSPALAPLQALCVPTPHTHTPA